MSPTNDDTGHDEPAQINTTPLPLAPIIKRCQHQMQDSPTLPPTSGGQTATSWSSANAATSNGAVSQSANCLSRD